MEKDSRRNSILKPKGLNLIVPIDQEEEQITENTTTVYRRRSMKRVSFSVRDEIKEFQKHEVLNVGKLEEALMKMQNEQDSKKEGIDEKENLRDIENAENPPPVNIKEFSTSVTVSNLSKHDVSSNMPVRSNCSIQHPNTEDWNKEFKFTNSTVMLLASHNDGEENHQVLQATIVCDLENSSIQEVEMQMTTECHDVGTGGPSLLHHNVSGVKMPMPHQMSDDGAMMTTAHSSGQFPMEQDLVLASAPSTNPSTVEESSHFVVNTLHLKNKLPHFVDDESEEFNQIVRHHQWQVLYREGELILRKMYDSVTIKFQLCNEFVCQNVRHYVISDFEIDTKKDIKDKWAKFGLTVLEMTLENSCGIKPSSMTTMDLPKFLDVVENPFQTFLEFMIEDADSFELLVNPRSLTIDLDMLELTFDLSNEQNLLWVRISLTLNPIFPLSAKNIIIENVSGNTNKIELASMISTIRPCGRYLTRVAECIEDFLKFRPTSECKLFSVSRP